ncbi:hypothetical protein [Paraburkholderia fynbosensis]|uniref:Uncharacterized protein n=1 Tax=Paraburkholderia fynbosensis TaxID=1200993 RepID=A0A6J5GTE0_9BURK|nr:hypothetical protein [Paraburkholderia fynbosensis]CAB3806018.1 hypothetical protein LMG27177_06021 [Paraburkholderia fynbosensis]
MMIDKSIQADLEARLVGVEEENEELLLQLHHVQEELGNYYLRNKVLEKKLSGQSPRNDLSVKGCVDEELQDALAENRRLHSLVEVQKKVHVLETQNALNSQLGSLLIQGVDSPKAMLALPGRLWKIWRLHSRHTPPQSLGGSDFSALLEAYRQGGFGAVEKLLAAVPISSVMHANGYTAIARHLMPGDRLGAAEAAQRAYALDPKPYRLKWLAFRLHEAGQVVEAAAMLDILPASMQFSDSEDRQASQLRYETHCALQREAKELARFAERRTDIEEQLNRLASERDDQARQLSKRCKEVELLKESNAQLEEDRRKVTGQYEKAASLATERAQELDVQKRTVVQLEQDMLLMADRQEVALRLWQEKAAQLESEKCTLVARSGDDARLLAERVQAIDELSRAKALLEQEGALLARQRDETVSIAAERSREIEFLQQARLDLLQEKATLAGRYEEVVKVLAERIREVDALRQATSQLEQDRSVLANRYDEVVRKYREGDLQVAALSDVKARLEQEKLKLADLYEGACLQLAQRTREVEQLQQANTHLEGAKSELSGLYEAVARQVDERNRENEILEQARKRLEHEKLELSAHHVESSTRAAESLVQVKVLHQQLQDRQANDDVLSARQKLMQEEIVRAEAQLDLIKDVLLRERTNEKAAN